MSEIYDYSKASVDIARLTLEILADETIIKTLEGISHNEGETPNDLHITFDEALTGGEKTALDTLVTNHTATPLTVYDYFCYCCGLNHSDPDLTAPTQCSCCSSTDIQDQYHKSNFIATTDPTAEEDVTEGYCVGSPWINISTGHIFKCINNTEDAAVWYKYVEYQPEVTLAGETPVDADVSEWADGDKGHGIGTTDKEFYMIKRGTVVKFTELS